jgi:hypothetical protein
MKKIIFLGWLIAFLPALLFAQEKIEAPVWNTGDKWAFDRGGPMEVVDCDAQCYSVKFSEGIFSKDASGIAVFERSTLNVSYIMEKDRRKEYRGFRKMILNFPLTQGKQWKDFLQRDEEGSSGGVGNIAVEYRETFRILGWEEIEVRAGKFKAIKLEYKIEPSVRTGFGWIAQRESKAWYWYSPEVKNFVKCKYEKGYQEAPVQERGSRENWELVSFQLKK